MTGALDLLSGDAQLFIEKIWASRTHVHRTEASALTKLLSLEDVDRLLTASALRTPAVRIVQGGKILPESTFTRKATIAGQSLTGLVDAQKALDLFRAGATVVFQGLHRYHPPLTRLVAELELELGHPCQANAYFTPAGNQGFAVHSDSHDVFVFQTAGVKQWEVHTGDGVEDVTMTPGRSLYLPTGTPHAAHAQETFSLHVTIGINQLTWRGLLRRTVEGVLPPDEHLPAGYLDDPSALRDGLAHRLRAMADRLTEIDTAAAAEAEVRRFLTSLPPRLQGGLMDSVAHLHDDTLLRRRPGHPCVVREHGDKLDLLLGDRTLTVPAKLRWAIEELRSRAEVRPADLPLDPQSRMVLCRRLLREGLLEVAR